MTLDTFIQAHAISAQFRKKHKIGSAHLRVLLFIHTRPTTPIMTEIAAYMGCSTAAITAVVDDLEKAHLVKRKYSKLDRRKVSVELIPKGTAVVLELKKLLANAQKPRLALIA